MKLTTLLNSAASQVTGYLSGSAAGPGRYTQIRSAATNLVRHPKVQQVAFDLAAQAKSHAHRLPGPAAHAVDKAATALRNNVTRPTDTAVNLAVVPETEPVETAATATPRVRNS